LERRFALAVFSIMPDQKHADQQRYVASQESEIDTQKGLVRGLEDHHEDAGIVRMEKRILTEMRKSLGMALRRLRAAWKSER
jgi:hypothetical protein